MPAWAIALLAVSLSLLLIVIIVLVIMFCCCVSRREKEGNFFVVVRTDLYIFLNFWYRHLQFISSSALSKDILAFRVLERKCMPFIERERTFSRKEAIPLGPESTPPKEDRSSHFERVKRR